MRTGFFNERVDDFIEAYPKMSNKELAHLFNLSINTVKFYAYRLGLHKDAEYLSKTRTEVSKLAKNKNYGTGFRSQT